MHLGGDARTRTRAQFGIIRLHYLFTLKRMRSRDVETRALLVLFRLSSVGFG